MKMQQMLRAMGQKDLPELKLTIKINPDHEIVKKLLARSDDAVAEDAAWLLFDQALLMEGAPLQDSAVFVQRLNRMLNLSIYQTVVRVSLRAGLSHQRLATSGLRLRRLKQIHMLFPFVPSTCCLC
jgi:Hsp90 protein